MKNRRVSWKIGIFAKSVLHSAMCVYHSHQKESEVFMKFSNHAQKPYFSTFAIVGDGK